MWILRSCSTADSAVRRLRHVHNVISTAYCSSSAGNVSSGGSSETDSVSIGDASVTLSQPNKPELVPTQHLPLEPGQSVLNHLRWIMQKDLLGQDVFLIGPPGPLRRHLAMQYCELTQREVEYVSLSRDTTESDLKQRREIQGGTAFYVDQAAVRAALEGRILILDGIEKAERNVLPVLNNLLENREMQLEDGCFLIPAARYDALVKSSSQAELDNWKLKRVSERFRVIALGLPVPRYKGNPLDPPLRSRFQGRDVRHMDFADALALMQQVAPNASTDKLTTLLSVASTISSTEGNTLGLPDYPLDSITDLAAMLNLAPDMPVAVLLQVLYPNTMLTAEGQKAYAACLEHFSLKSTSVDNQPYALSQVSVKKEDGHSYAEVELANKNGSAVNFTTPAGCLSEKAADKSFVMTDFHSGLLAQLLLSHSAGDVCIIGPKGCGKTAVARYFADVLQYNCESVLLYQDMTARDLLQQRMTLPNGDTSWRPSPLVTAALHGNLAVLDGLHRINAGTLAVLQRLLHDRELNLYDGTKLLRHDRYEHLKEQLGVSDEEMAKRGVRPIHPSFRVLALAEPPVLNTQKAPWLNPESLTMFMYHYMRPLDSREETRVLKELVPGCDESQLGQLLHFTQALRSNQKNATLASLSSSLSTRQLLRVAKRMEQFGSEDIHSAVHKACLSQFLPQMARGILNDHLEAEDIVPVDRSSTEDASTTATEPWAKEDGALRIGRTTVALLPNENQVKVPDVLFYDNPQHTRVMEEMLKDFALGEHLLLVGNQGVGKNKLVDRFLYLLDRPREYIQLHRDTTVQSLTLQPTVKDGRILYEDSPMVVALQRGHVLVVDEADKAPTHVTCILKALVESGEMILGDGRRVVTGGVAVPKDLDNVIVAHPNFRLIVLANRPGFPFLGNDFFASLGDMFSCHAIGNPDMLSELAMLRQYGPDVPGDILSKLVSAFSELRGLADDGLISYPYSTREVVNIVKHLQKFHEEGLPMVVRNVFDFDRHQPELQEQLISILQKHGIPLGVEKDGVKTSKKFPLPVPSFAGRFFRGSAGQEVTWQEKPLSIQGDEVCPATVIDLDRDHTRTKRFSEKFVSFNLPLSGSSRSVSVSSVQKDPSDQVYIATSSPSALYSMSLHGKTAKCFELYDYFPQLSWTQTLELSVVGLQNSVSGDVIVHEASKGELLLINVDKESVKSIAFREDATESIDMDERIRSRQKTGKSFICGDFTADDIVYVYTAGSNAVDMINVLDASRQSLELPFPIKSVVFHDKSSWLVTAADGSVHSLTGDAYLPSQLSPLHAEGDERGLIPSGIVPAWIGPAASNANLSSTMNIATNDKGHIMQLTNMSSMDPANPVEVHHVLPVTQATVPPLWLPESQLLVQVVPEAPASQPAVSQDSASDSTVATVASAKSPAARLVRGRHLRVVDFQQQSVRYMQLTSRRGDGQQAAPAAFSSKPRLPVATTGLSSGDVLTVQSDGTVDLFQIAADKLERSLSEWQKMVGLATARKLQINYNMKDGQMKTRGKMDGKGKDKKGVDAKGKPLTKPKHGKVDANNAPHVGGNQWAGGTGGRDTAGLGGVGGPYRLDAGHDVHQVPDEVKEAVPREITAAARAMALKAWKDKLKDIDMAEFDAQLYDKLSASVRQQVAALKVVIEGLEAKQKDRSWTRHQTSGELDDNKLIEGLTGEKDIYRRRTDLDPDGQDQQKPKRLRLLVDVSGSMYRFNGVDGRLEREIQAVLMVMQALEKHQDKISLDIVGHSGEGETTFLKASQKNLNDKQRLSVLLRMQTHTQMCLSGDCTVEATENSVEEIAKEEADEHFVIVLSDANFSRYGIQSSTFSKVMSKDAKVNVFIIFIGSLGDQAVRLVQQLPSGRAFICMDTSTLPKVLQSIFTTAILH
eukprot:scpid7831/ scgid4687/ Uncharacterized protein KIAA0564 homolog